MQDPALPLPQDGSDRSLRGACSGSEKLSRRLAEILELLGKAVDLNSASRGLKKTLAGGHSAGPALLGQSDLPSAGMGLPQAQNSCLAAVGPLKEHGRLPPAEPGNLRPQGLPRHCG